MRHRPLRWRSVAITAALAVVVVGCQEGTTDPPEPQVAEAVQDNDSPTAPAVSHFLRVTGLRNFTYTDEISAPTGDGEDFVEFEFPNNFISAQTVWVTLECTSSGDPDAVAGAQVFEDGVVTSLAVDCNSGEQRLTVDNTKTQLVRIGFNNASEAAFVAYTIAVVGYR